MFSSIPIVGAVAAAILGRQKKTAKYCYETVYTPTGVCPLQDGTKCIKVQIAENATCKDIVYQTLTPQDPKNFIGVLNDVSKAPDPPTVTNPSGSLVSYPNSTTPRVTVTCISSGPFQDTTCATIELRPLYSGELYLELAGGAGASHTWYTSLGAKVTHTGGLSGHLFGTLLVNVGDVLTIDFGFSALPTTPLDLATATLPQVPLGGGVGTLLAGSSGGGATRVLLNGTLVMIAGGGGGGSRNANGGDSGCSEPLVLFQKTTLATAGKAGFVNKIQKIVDPVYLSGGGATQQGPGDSKDPNGRGASFVGGSASEGLSSGAGGGSGYYGGGAGFTNQMPKPMNTHGAGGGGSCYVRQNVFFSSFQGTRYTNQYSAGVNPKKYPRDSFVSFGFPVPA